LIGVITWGALKVIEKKDAKKNGGSSQGNSYLVAEIGDLIIVSLSLKVVFLREQRFMVKL